MLSKAPNRPVDERSFDLAIPYDADTNISAKALEWLKGYHLDLFDLIRNRILWSPSRELLIFPYDGAWQGRYFGTEDKPKWYSRGHLDDLVHGFNLDKAKSGVILVEDIVSAIRIGRLGFPCVCLFGSYLSARKMNRLRFLTNKVIFWLDNDKRKESTEQAIRLLEMGIDSDVIVTPLDPKSYTDGDIRCQLLEYK